MITVGITGGIGCGKTTICRLLETKFSVPIYYSDSRAKELMTEQQELRSRLTELFGSDVYRLGVLNRELIASVVFSDKKKLQRLNEAVHGAVMDDFREWARGYDSDYVVCESAILIECGWFKEIDVVVLVKAPEDQRIERVIRRDGLTRDQVISRISSQTSDTDKECYADIVVLSDDSQSIEEMVDELHSKLLLSNKTKEA